MKMLWLNQQRLLTTTSSTMTSAASRTTEQIDEGLDLLDEADPRLVNRIQDEIIKSLTFGVSEEGKLTNDFE